MNKRSLAILFSVVLMDMVGFGFMIPILPDYVKAFGGDGALYGLVLSAYALGQFFAAPIVGRLSDRYGRKPLFLISIFGTFVSLIVLGFAHTLTLIFVSRIIDGLTGGNITIAQAYISDLTTSEDRARGLGIIGAAFGLGFIIGPIFGGFLMTFGLAVPALTAAGIAGANLILISLILPESLPQEKRRTGAGNPLRRFSPKLFIDAIRLPHAGDFLVMMAIYTLAFNMFETMFSPHAADVIGLSPRSRGLVLAYVGVIVAGVQGGGIGALTRRFGEKKLLNFSLPVLSLSLLAWGLTGSLRGLLIVLFPLSAVAGISSVLLRSILTKSVPEEEIGGILGVSNSIESMNRVIAPALGGLLLTRMGPRGPGFAGAALVAVVVIILLVRGNAHINSLEKKENHDE